MRDREAWHAAVHRVAKSQTRLGERTTTSSADMKEEQYKVRDFYRQKGTGTRKLNQKKKKASCLFQGHFPLGEGSGSPNCAYQAIPDQLV